MLAQKIPGFLPLKVWHALIRTMHPLDLIGPYRTHLVMACLEGAYRLPSFLWEVNPTLALGLETFHPLNLNVPYQLNLRVLLFYFSFVQFVPLF